MSNRTIADLIKIDPLGSAIGARVDGIDLAKPLDAASRARLGDAQPGECRARAGAEHHVGRPAVHRHRRGAPLL